MPLTKSPGDLVTADDWNDLVDLVQSSAPIGSMMPFAGSTAPTGWLLCAGAAVSRTTYADLFALLGTTYGSGDGSTTFNLPDLRGRSPLGKDDMGGTSANRVTATQADNLGQGAGAETHTLLAAEMPQHTHGISDAIWGVAGGAATVYAAGPNTSKLSTASGGGGSHNNMPPYLTLNYIIKS